MPCTRSCAVGESKWTVVVPGMRWRNWEILLLSEVARTVSMVVKSRSLDGLHSTRWVITGFRTLLMLSLMATSGVKRGVPSLLTMSRRSRRVRPFLGEGALGVIEAGATAGVGFADGIAFIRKIRVLRPAPSRVPGALDVRLQNSLVQTFICFVRR